MATGANHSESSLNDVTLDEIEIGAALLNAQQKKAAAMRTAEYWERVSREPDPVVMAVGELREYVLKVFRERSGREFHIDEYNKEIFELLLWYFCGDPRFKEYGFSPKKGIALYGTVGCGKTALMKMFRSNPVQSYSVRGCREVSDQVEQEGSEAAKFYMDSIETSRNIFRQFKLGICFDDVGLEPVETVYYGNRKKIMEEIIWTRYHKDLPFNFTHITTNLNAEEIRARYGERIASRMNEMFNLIPFPEDSLDRRK